MGSILEKKRELDALTQRYKDLNSEQEKLNEKLREALDIVVAHPDVTDGVELASQMGRLDFVSTVLGMFAIIIAVLSFVGFWMVRRDAISAAEEAARDEVNKKAPEMFNQAKRLRGVPQNDDAEIKISDQDAESIVGQAKEVDRD